MNRKGRIDHRGELLRIYQLLDDFFGALHWWPASTPFEVMVGAILTQNTAWSNVETAIASLRKKRLLSPEAMIRVTETDLADVIRSSGYYNLKASRLKSFVHFFVDKYSGRVEAMGAENLPVLRAKLLGVKGIGPETADSILLYACQKAIFVVDAYTRRIFQRHGLINHSATYDEIQSLVMDSVPADAPFFNQFHALIVNAAKEFCKKKPDCPNCPLAILNKGRSQVKQRPQTSE